MMLSADIKILLLEVFFAPECYGRLTKTYKVKKVGVKEALKKFEEKDGPGPANMKTNANR